MIETFAASDLWERALGRIRTNLPAQTYETWFRSIAALEAEGGNLVLEVPSQFYVDWIDQHYRALIESSLASAAGQAVGITFHVRSGPEAEPMGRPTVPAPSRDASALVPQNTFETFIVGSGNQFAHAVCQAVAQSPGQRYNPLFLYGGVGLGKTHLMHAIGHHVRAERPGARIFFVSAEKFMNEMIYSIQHATTLEFKARYRSADLLLIDDIQFLAGKESTQEEFFHTFNALHDAHRQIVLTSDGPPNAMTALEERLVSRFTWGVVADLSPPDLETRVAIVKKKAELQGRNIPNEIALLLASNIKTNIRDLEGSLSRLLAFAELTNSPLTVEFAQDVLRDQIKPDLARIDVHDIQRLVARHFNVSDESLRGKRRTDTIAFPRQIGMYIARAMTDLSLAEIGAKFGGRDHTTVLHACQKIEGLMGTDREIRATVEELMGKLNG
ncbi:MAG: chromosomal replication initiator protein DnaA [Hyphomicrobiales bacterium]